MLGKKLVSFKKLAKKVKQPQQYKESLLKASHLDNHDDEANENSPREEKTPTGFLAVYVGEERRRFVVPTRSLSHPLFKMLLEKAYDEFGFQQRRGLVVPCSVATFQEVLAAAQCPNGRFHFGNLVQDFL